MAPEPKVGDPPATIPGMGQLIFNIGVDTNGTNRALLGAVIGENIDIFALPFDITGVDAPMPPPEGHEGDVEASGAQRIRIHNRGAGGELLAITEIIFSTRRGGLDANGPGIIDGTPDEGDPRPDGRIAAGVDIIFNTHKVPWHVVPEPGSGLLLLSGCIILALWRSRVRLHRNGWVKNR